MGVVIWCPQLEFICPQPSVEVDYIQITIYLLLQAVAINCLTVALSVSSSSKVNDLFLSELSTSKGCFKAYSSLKEDQFIEFSK